MSSYPVLTTPRLILRPFVPEDAPTVQQLAGAPEIAATTLTIPHPYPDGAAEAWIATHAPAFADGSALTLAITLREGGGLIGAVGLAINLRHKSAEMGYWIGLPWWSHGFCTEAARAVLHYAFERLALNRVRALHLAENPASGRVMQKIGMRWEGQLRQAVCHRGRFADTVLYAALREDGVHLSASQGIARAAPR